MGHAAASFIYAQLGKDAALAARVAGHSRTVPAASPLAAALLAAHGAAHRPSNALPPHRYGRRRQLPADISGNVGRSEREGRRGGY